MLPVVSLPCAPARYSTRHPISPYGSGPTVKYHSEIPCTAEVLNSLLELSASHPSVNQGFVGPHRQVSLSVFGKNQIAFMSTSPAQSTATRRSHGPRNPSLEGLGISPVRDVSLLEHGVNRPGGSHVGTPPKRDTADRMVPSSLLNQFGFGQPRTPKIVQAGDPVLHEPAKDVTPQDMGSPAVEKVINDMVTAMRAAPGVGLAAPQLGVALNIIVLEDTEELMSFSDPAEVMEQDRRPFSLLVILNPKLRLVGNLTARFFEGCLSVEGYRAMVERHLEVEVEGLSREGEVLRIQAKGWQARILQHECDHLAGTLYVDRMLSRTFRAKDNLRMPLPQGCLPMGKCCGLDMEMTSS